MADDYSGMNIAYAELPGSQWEGSSLSGTDLRCTDLSGAKFKDCDLTHAQFAGTGYFGTTFERCNMREVVAPGSDFSQATFTQVHTSHANFASGILEKSAWTNSHLGGSVLDEASITGAALHFCNLETVSARFTDFSGTTFFGSVLDGSDLSWSNLSGARFPGVSLFGVNLYGALLEDIHLDSRRQIHISGKISQSLFYVFSYIGRRECSTLASLLQEKVQGRSANEFPDFLTHQALQSVEDYNREEDDAETRQRKQNRVQMKQVSLNFASGIVQHEPHTEGNPIAEIMLGWLDEYLKQ